MKKSQWIVGILALVALIALVVWARAHVQFDFHVFASQVALADWRMIVFAGLCIYANFVFRAFRWSQLVRHMQKVPPLSLVGSQVIGFTAVALIGRVADPVRPYLVAKKTGLSLSTQVAVYIVERLVDAGSVALIFSIAMIWVPGDAIHECNGARVPIGTPGVASPAAGPVCCAIRRISPYALERSFCLQCVWPAGPSQRFSSAASGWSQSILAKALATRSACFMPASIPCVHGGTSLS